MGSSFAKNERYTHIHTHTHLQVSLHLNWQNRGRSTTVKSQIPTLTKLHIKKRLLKLMFAFLHLYIFEFTEVYMTCT